MSTFSFLRSCDEGFTGRAAAMSNALRSAADGPDTPRLSRRYSRSSAAAPATYGAAMLVPEAQAYPSVCTRHPATKMSPSQRVERTDSMKAPGASTSGFTPSYPVGPRLENAAVVPGSPGHAGSSAAGGTGNWPLLSSPHVLPRFGQPPWSQVAVHAPTAIAFLAV